MNTFGANLKALRKFYQISQKEFASKLNTTQQRVSEWECDKVEPSLYNIVAIIKFFGITFEELIEGVCFTTEKN